MESLTPSSSLDALRLRKRFVSLAGMALTLILLLAIGGSLRNYSDNVPPNERADGLATIYDSATPAFEFLHRYGGYLLVALLPACGIPLLRLRRLLQTKDGAVLGVLGILVVALGIVVPTAALYTGHETVTRRQTTSDVVDIMQNSPMPADLDWHVSWVPLALAAVTLLILLAALRVHRAVPKPGREKASTGH